MKRNKCLFIAFILGVFYAVYAVNYFTGIVDGNEGVKAFSASLATAIVTPHLISVMIAVIFNGLAVFMNKSGFTLVAAILYAVSMALFPPYSLYVIVQMILSFIAYGQQKKLNKA